MGGKGLGFRVFRVLKCGILGFGISRVFRVWGFEVLGLGFRV